MLRNLEVIGEAAKFVPSSVKEKYSEVPWQRMIGMRNILIHEYFGVDLEIVWQVITHDLPPVIQRLRKIVSELEQSHEPQEEP